MRVDNREPEELRKINVIPNFLKYADGSAIIELGNTRVLCTASLDNHSPPHLVGTGQGWVTAEYDMHPCASTQRKMRDRIRGRIPGRSAEIQRLIGRSLRAVVELEKLGERTFYIDCDVLQADGGTRTASITGAYIALALAMQKHVDEGKLGRLFLKDFIAAISVGIVEETMVLDLSYLEDSQAAVDMNVVMNGSDEMIEIQGTAEIKPFSPDQLSQMIVMAQKGIHQLISVQKEILDIEKLSLKE